MSKLVDLTGKRVGKWTVLRRVNVDVAYSASWWLCRCECGKEQAITVGNLTKGISKPKWGCSKCRERRGASLIGKRFGKWVVFAESEKRSRRRCWLCRCECGTVREIPGDALRGGRTRGCRKCVVRVKVSDEVVTDACTNTIPLEEIATKIGYKANTRYKRILKLKNGIEVREIRRSMREQRRRGRLYITKAGYKRVWMPEHPNASKDGYVFEHILVMSKKYNRRIDTPKFGGTENVHHLNTNKLDNRTRNLQLRRTAPISRGAVRDLHEAYLDQFEADFAGTKIEEMLKELRPTLLRLSTKRFGPSDKKDV